MLIIRLRIQMVHVYAKQTGSIPVVHRVAVTSMVHRLVLEPVVRVFARLVILVIIAMSTCVATLRILVVGPVHVRYSM